MSRNCGWGKPSRAGSMPCFMTTVIDCKAPRTAICLGTVVGVRKGILPVRYFCSNKSSFSHQLNVLKIVTWAQN